MIDYVADRDRVFLMAPAAPAEALQIARRVAHPWYRSQALAAVARCSDDSGIEDLAGEAVAAALQCHDDYQRSAVLAWTIAALIERGRHPLADAVLAQARGLAATAIPNGSRACALLMLQASAPELVREIVDDMLDERWRRKTIASLARWRERSPRAFFGG